MKKSQAWVFFLTALALMFFIVYHFYIDDAGNRGINDQLRLNQTDDVVLIELTGYDEQRLEFEKHGPGSWFSNDSVKIDALLVNDFLGALQRIQIRHPVPVMNRQQLVTDLTYYGVQIKVYAGKHWINLPGNLRMFPRRKKIYDALLGYDTDVFDQKVISRGNGTIPYEIHLPSRNRNIDRFLTFDLNYWRDPVVVSLLPSEISNISVSFPANPMESFELKLFHDTFVIKDKKGTIVDAEMINKPRLARFVNAFRDLTHEKYIATKPGQFPDDAISSEPFLRQYITEINGNTTELIYYYRKAPNDGTLVSEFREYDPNRFYLETLQGDFSLAKFFVFQPTMRPLSYFLENTE